MTTESKTYVVTVGSSYQSEPSTVHEVEANYYQHEHGRTTFKLGGVFVADFPSDWVQSILVKK